MLDKWCSYDVVLVNHSLRLFSLEDPSVHTRKIEGIWSFLKKNLRNRLFKGGLVFCLFVILYGCK